MTAITDTLRDTFILAVTAFAEASSEGASGVRAQIHSVINRHDARKWYSGKTLAATCLQPYAYSAWNSKDPNRVRALAVNTADPVWVMCCDEVELALRGISRDPTDGATHYYVAGTREPTWVSGKNDAGEQLAPPAVFTVQIGQHRFYKGVA